jgi:hypothetical protein
MRTHPESTVHFFCFFCKTWCSGKFPRP